MTRKILRSVCCAAALGLSIATSAQVAAATPTAAEALQLAPIQKGIEYDRPTAEEAAKCQIGPLSGGNQKGWVVQTADGSVLRKFVDTNADNRVDVWCYYKDGVEVYRDIDSNYNGKVDQYRWFHTGGSRWGIDKDEDGTVDSWKAISAEEAAAEAVAALANGDPRRFARLVLNANELKGLGLGDARATQLKEKLGRVMEEFNRKASQQKALAPNSRCLQFSAGQPGAVPAGTDGSSLDLTVYENAVAIVETEGKHAQVQLGTLVRVGDAWRLIDAPSPMAEGQNETGMSGLFFRGLASANRPKSLPGSDMKLAQDAIDQLREIDRQAEAAKTPAEQAAANTRRADMLEKIAELHGTAAERDMWYRQLCDTISAAVQSGTYPDGLKRMEALYQKVSRSPDQRELAAYVRFRIVFADYFGKASAQGVDPVKLQEQLQKNLEDFVTAYPKAAEASEAMLQLAMHHEFAGQEDEARKWYTRITQNSPDTPAGRKATGALNRLEAVGKVLSFRGKSLGGETIDLSKYRGRVVLLQFWSSTNDVCKLEMPVLKELVGKYDALFTVVSVSLDDRLQDLNQYLSSSRLSWPQVYEEGGLDSRPANELGIVSLPTMLLIDQTGKVVSRNIRVAELEGELKKLIR